MMRIGQVRLRGVAAMAGLANDTAVQPRHGQRQARGAKRLASALAWCASRGKPGGVIARHPAVPPFCPSRGSRRSGRAPMSALSLEARSGLY